MSDRPCYAVVTEHGCIVAVGKTREAAISEARRRGLRRGTTTTESSVMRVRRYGRWAYECDRCRKPRRRVVEVL